MTGEHNPGDVYRRALKQIAHNLADSRSVLRQRASSALVAGAELAEQRGVTGDTPSPLQVLEAWFTTYEFVNENSVYIKPPRAALAQVEALITAAREVLGTSYQSGSEDARTIHVLRDSVDALADVLARFDT